MHAEAFDHAVRARDGAIRHRPHQHVHALGHQRREIPERVVRRAGLRVAAVRLHLHGVDEVGKLDGILDEEHRDVVADQIEVAFLGIELDGEAAHVARQVDRAGAAGDGGEAYEDLGLLLRVLQEGRLGELGERFRRLEVAMRPGAARMHDALGDALMVEMGDLLAQDEIFEQARAALAALERILIVGDRRSLVGRQPLLRTAGILVRLPAIARFRARVGAFPRLAGHLQTPAFDEEGCDAMSPDSIKHRARELVPPERLETRSRETDLSERAARSRGPAPYRIAMRRPAASGRGRRRCAACMRARQPATSSGKGAVLPAAMSTCSDMFSEVAETQPSEA